jgi:predicted ATPase
LLTTEEQSLFRRLCVFVGGCTLEAAAAVCHAEGDLTMDVVDGATSLMDKSLLQQAEQEEEPRLVLLETVREYGLECLHAREEAERCHRAHAEYYLTLAEPAQSGT